MKFPSRILAKAEISSVLSKPIWTVHDLINHAAPLNNPPSEGDIMKLSKLAALDKPTQGVMQSFVNQLKFIEALRSVDTKTVEPVVRLVKPCEVTDLECLREGDMAPEIGNWQPTSLSAEKESDYYVVKDTLHGVNIN